MGQKVGLLALTTFLTLCCLEVFSRTYAAVFTDYETEMWRYARELKMEVPDPREMVHRPQTHVRLMGVDVQTDEKGRRQGALSAQPQRPALAVVGDSVTFGWGVPASMTFPELIGKSLSENAPVQQVHNYGIGNHNLPQLLAKLRLEVISEKPAALLWVFYINDIEMKSASHKSFLDRHLLSASIASNAFHKLNWWLQGAHSYESHYQDLFQKNQNEIIKSINSIGQETQHIPVRYALLVPDLNSRSLPAIDSIYKNVEETFRAAGFQTLNLQTLDHLKSPDYWVSNQDAHPGTQAHQVIARSFCHRFPELCNKDLIYAE